MQAQRRSVRLAEVETLEVACVRYSFPRERERRETLNSGLVLRSSCFHLRLPSVTPSGHLVAFTRLGPRCDPLYHHSLRDLQVRGTSTVCEAVRFACHEIYQFLLTGGNMRAYVCRLHAFRFVSACVLSLQLSQVF